jgi:hypothetical protein
MRMLCYNLLRMTLFLLNQIVPYSYILKQVKLFPLQYVPQDLRQSREASTTDLGGVWDRSAPVFPAPLQLHGAKHI